MNHAANTLPKALRQLDLSLETAEEVETELRDEQADLGESLRDLRIAAMVPRNAIAQRLGMDSMQVAGVEHRATADIAKKYREAVIFLSENYYKR